MNSDAKILTGIIIGSVLLLVGAVFFLSNQSGPKTKETKAVDQSILIKDNSNKISTPSASLTIVEFGDYQCPACKIAFAPLKKVLDENPTKINFVFRHFPLPQHKNGMQAARAAEAAGEQSKYFQMHDKLYETQDDWAQEINPSDKFVTYAKELGLDSEKFKSSLNSNKFDSKIKSDQSDGVALGVNGTPTLFFNGQQYDGNLSYQDLKSKADSLLPR